MNRLCAFLLLAGLALSASRRRAAAPSPSALDPLTPEDIVLLFARSPSKALH